MNRPDLFVYLALAAAWVFIGAWTLRIGSKANRLQDAMDGQRDARRSADAP